MKRMIAKVAREKMQGKILPDKIVYGMANSFRGTNAENIFRRGIHAQNALLTSQGGKANGQQAFEFVKIFTPIILRQQHAFFGGCLQLTLLNDSNKRSTGSHGQTINYLRELKSSLPIVVLTSLNDQNVGKDLVHMGVQDYLPKDDLNPTLLQRMCSYAIERKKQQVALEEKTEDQEAFCRSLSHDFKGPVRNIGIFVKILEEKIGEHCELTEEEHEIIGLIQQKTEIMQALIENLYQYMLVEVVDQDEERVDLNTLVANIATLHTETADTAAKIDYENLPEVLGHYSQLFLLFQNIIQNTIKYNENIPHIRISSQVDDEKILISIKDNGIGIEPRFYEMIFKPFQRLHSHSKYSGTGLGLSIVKRIIERHKGSVQVQSEPGKGSEFLLCFPALPQ